MSTQLLVNLADTHAVPEQPPFNTRASRSAIHMWAKAIGSRNRLYFDETYSRQSAHGQIVAPSTFLYSVHDTTTPSTNLDVNSWYAGVAWRFHRLVRRGDEIQATSMATGSTQKTGAFAGAVTYRDLLTEYRTPTGQLIAEANSTMVEFDRARAVSEGKYEYYENYPYTAVELGEIEVAYGDENIRANEPRYFEDVNVGDSLGRIVRGPLTSEDIIMFVERNRPALTYQRFIAAWQDNPALGFVDDYGMPDSWEGAMLLKEICTRLGLPLPHDAGYQRVAWCDDFVRNWCGDLGFIARLDVRLLRPNLHGFTTWITGKVVDKRVDGDATVADLELEGHNQLGELSLSGCASVELPSMDIARATLLH